MQLQWNQPLLSTTIPICVRSKTKGGAIHNYELQIDNVIVDKSKAFALKVIALYKKLCDTNREFVMSKQLLKSGTSIGANIKEAQQGQSKADFYAKLLG